MSECPSCKNEFMQPFVCTTCGAEKLYDATLASITERRDQLEQRLKVVEAENARLKAAMDKYSEDEMLLIERCAKVCEVMGAKHFECPEMSEYCADAIRALKVERRSGGERRVSKGNKWRDECWNVLRSGTDRRKA